MDQHERHPQDPHKVTQGSTSTDHETVSGVRFMSQPRYHKKPWQLSLYHNGTVTRSFHASLEDAKAAKRKAERLKSKEGSRALGYNRAAQTEYEAAKRIVGPNTPLVPLLRQLASRQALGGERKTVAEAVEHLIQAKEKLEVGHRTLKDLRSRLRIFSATFSSRELEGITRNEVVDWLNGLGCASRTVWNFYATIGGLFNYAERRSWIEVNPMRKIDPDSDLPKVRKGVVQILTLEQGEAVMRFIEKNHPPLIAWACVQYFAGIRDAESERLHGEWIEAKERRIVLPGWHIEGEKVEGITKTRDDWVMDNLPDALWAWVDRYPESFKKGRIASPSNRLWDKIRAALVKDKVFDEWPANGFRHSFATYHLSALRDQSATSLVLRHQNANRLWNSYLAKLVPSWMGLKYLSLMPI